MDTFSELDAGKKLMTIKYPTRDDNSDWEYIIVNKADEKEAEKYIKEGNIKDMKTILYNTKKMIQEERNSHG